VGCAERAERPKPIVKVFRAIQNLSIRNRLGTGSLLGAGFLGSLKGLRCAGAPGSEAFRTICVPTSGTKGMVLQTTNPMPLADTIGRAGAVMGIRRTACHSAGAI